MGGFIAAAVFTFILICASLFVFTVTKDGNFIALAILLSLLLIPFLAGAWERRHD